MDCDTESVYDCWISDVLSIVLNVIMYDVREPCAS